MTSASGSVGGMTYSHNRSGMYMRARRVPTNPNTGFQQAVRSNLSNASQAFRLLDAGEQASWATYAAGTPRVNRLGDTITLTAQQMYVAVNSLAALLGLAPMTNAPAVPGLSTLGNDLALGVDASTGTLTIDGVTGSLFRQVGAKIGVFVGDGKSLGVNFYKAPYQLFDVMAGATGTATSVTLPGLGYRGSTALVTSMKLPIRIAAIDVQGRLSNVHEELLTPT
jgi:hypothetical protein